MNRTRTLAVSLRPNAVVVETTDHRNYAALRKVLAVALRARSDVGQVDGIEHIGLRYIDEIRVPDNNGSDVRWESWLSDQLLGPANAGNALGFRAKVG